MGTPISDRPKKVFPVTPAGQQRIVCGDVILRPQMQDKFGIKDKVDLLFFSEHLTEEGEMHSFVRRFTESLSEKAELRKFLHSWRGHDLLPSEFTAGPNGRLFDLDKVIGLSGFSSISHKETPKKTYAIVKAIMPLGPGMEPLQVPENYVRVKDRDAKKMLEEAFGPEDYV